MTFTDEELARCARRELSHRVRVYLRLVAEHKMDQLTADREIAMMQAIATFFEERAQPTLL